MPRPRPPVVSVLLLVLVSTALGCLHVRPAARPSGPAAAAVEPEAAGSPRLHPDDRRLLLVMIDGLPVHLFETALAQGEVPRIARLTAERPTVATTALSTFPSSTFPSLAEMLSGDYAESADPSLPGAVHAFDRQERRVVRYFTQPGAWQWPIPDLFSAAAQSGVPALTVAEGRWDGAQSILTRGPELRAAVLETLGIEGSNGDREPVEALIRQLRRPSPPVVVLLIFNSVDLAGHFSGPDSPDAHRALEETDALLGQVLDTLEAATGADGRPLLDDTTVVLFGDHGMVSSGNFLDLQPIFQRRKLSTFDASSVSQIAFRERLGTLWTRWPDVLLVAGGSNVTQIYFRRPSGSWDDAEPPSPGEARKAARTPSAATYAPLLAELPGVAQVLRSLPDGRVELLAAGGRLAWVERRGAGHDQTFAYVVPAAAESDPLEYLKDPLVEPRVCRQGEVGDACFLSREDWQLLTFRARFAGVVPLLHKALNAERFTGDLVVTALPGYTFLRGQKGDHGNLERQAMTTPLLFNGPGIDPATPAPLVRLVDLFPTVAVLLGADRGDPALVRLDGRALPFVRPPPG
jgi:Type I phosphodiesterase / nucleotide pyrophosphatase